MKLPLRSLLVALAVAGGLTACGSADQKTDQKADTAAQTAPVAETAATPAAAETPPAAPAADATFDLGAVPVTSAELGVFPYLSPLKDYEVNTSNSEDYEFERSYVYDGKNLVPIEGKVSQRLINPNSGGKKASELMIQRNYENLLKSLGATKVHSGPTPQAAIEKVGSEQAYKQGKWVLSPDHATDTYVIRQKNKEIWAQVTPLGSDGAYGINVTERAAMPQQATTLKADEPKKN